MWEHFLISENRSNERVVSIQQNHRERKTLISNVGISEMKIGE